MPNENRVTKIVVSLAIAAVMVTSPVAFAATKTAQKTPARAHTKSTTTATTAKTTTTAKASSSTGPKKKTYSASAARARQAQLASARSAAARRSAELREVQTPRFKVDEYGREVPDVRAEAAIIYNPETGEVLWENHSKDQRSMASITKVMTAIVFLESNTPLTNVITVQPIDVRNASTTYLRAGYKLPAEDLLNLLLVGSDNAAARTLARNSNLGYDAFIQRMNEKAKELGLESTVYADPSGLLADNMSSAYDLARLIAYAAADERIGSIMRKATYTTQSGRTTIAAHSTNQIVRTGDIDVVGGKTGFISRSGYCLATLLRLPESGQQVAFVVMGAKSNASRFWETRHLFNWMSTRTKSLLEGDFQQQPPPHQNDDQ